MNYEERVIEFNKIIKLNIDAYFRDSPQLERTEHNERLLEAGFRMGFFEAEERMLGANNANG